MGNATGVLKPLDELGRIARRIDEKISAWTPDKVGVGPEGRTGIEPTSPDTFGHRLRKGAGPRAWLLRFTAHRRGRTYKHRAPGGKLFLRCFGLPREHAFAVSGDDQIGRDMLSRVIWGTRLSLYVGLVSVLIGVTLGALWGAATAYFGGVADTASQRVVDSLMALPPISLALGLMAALGQSVNNVILALTILLTPTAARTVRSVALGIMASPYIEAAQAAGASHLRIIARHVLPNCLATYIVLVTTNVSYAIVVEAALSFLGVGAPADEPSWGGMLTAGTQAIESAPWMIFFPGLAISVAVFALNLLGDSIRDVADPRLRGGLG